MPFKRGKFSSRFPTARIKKIMQLDDDVGKVSATVPPVVSRALELFVEKLMCSAFELTKRNHSKTITPSHLKHAIQQDTSFSFAEKLVVGVTDLKFVDDESVEVMEGEVSAKKRRGRRRKTELGDDEDEIPVRKKRKYTRRNVVPVDTDQSEPSYKHQTKPKANGPVVPSHSSDSDSSSHHSSDCDDS